MEWTKYTIKTTTIGEDLVCNLLAELDIAGIEIEDNVPITEEEKQEMYIDILPELPEDQGIAYVSFYLEKGEDAETLLKDIQAGLEELRSFLDIGEATITTSSTKEEDWIDNWKEFFKSFEIEDIIIKPTWEEEVAKEEEQIVIEIDPGTAFGTGKHETTQLCIRQLKKYLKEDMKILDAGCGSGILSMIAIKMGADFVTAIDIDERAVEVTHENMEVNKIPKDRYEAKVGNLIEDYELQKEIGNQSYDFVLANILADIIVPLTPHIPDALKPGGIYVTSGILYNKEEIVRDAMVNAGFEIIDVMKQGDWVSLTGKKGK